MKDRLPSVKKKLKVLTRDEANLLFYKVKQGCIESRNKIVEHNLGLVPQECSRRVFPNHPTITFEDLYQQGVLGLMDAVRGFKPEMGFAFSTYAKFHIKQKIYRYIQDHKSAIRMPVYALEIKRLFERVKRENNDKDHDFWIRVVAKQKKSTPEAVGFIINNNAVFCSLDKPAEDHEESIQISSDLFGEEIESTLDHQHILRILNLLSEKEKEILVTRYNGSTLQEIANEFKVSREAIRQRINIILKKISALMSLKVTTPSRELCQT